jgi:predicted GNAT superfamily acetyltransferase
MGPPAAMMVAMRRDDDYDSPNFLWFRDGFDNFAYVDRIATAAAARRSGVGSALYAVLEAWARTNEMTSIVCEVNLQPRNQGSIDFHRACGFREVGQKLSHGKPVAMMQKMLRH